MSATEMALVAPEVEVVAKANRRRFTVECKRKVVREADGCKTAGAVGALLRREGLHTSPLTAWRAARERGESPGAPKKRGPVPQTPDSRDKKITELERETARWRKRAERAEALVEVQKKWRRCWGVVLAPPQKVDLTTRQTALYRQFSLSTANSRFQ